MSQLDNIINIQILYNPSQPTESECWNGSFYLISLYSALEHLSSDSKNIKESMICMAKYIENKKIDTTKSNNVFELKGIDKSTWGLISAIYSSGCDFFLLTN